MLRAARNDANPGPGRRTFLIASLALSLPLPAATPPPPKVGAIRWPGPAGDIHGYMAVPASARGRQPAVLVITDRGDVDRFALGLVDALAGAGFVTCIAKALASLEEASATVRWLATNAYATGKVAVIGIGWGGELAERVAAAVDPPLAAAITFGTSSDTEGAVPALRLAPVGMLTGAPYEEAWRRVIAFLKEHLG